jgi:hypothetical protein
MPGMEKHPPAEAARSAAPRSNHRWLLFAIAIPAAVEVWACWVGLGSLCGFPKIGGKSTDWTLAIGMEAYGGYALYVWLGGAPGPRSRAFAQWSALGAFALSLVGQVAYHLMLAKKMTRAPAGVIVFVACLLVVVLAFAAILTHLMHSDARNAAEAIEESELRAALAAEQTAHAQAAAERDAARQEKAELAAAAAKAEARADALARKLAAIPKPVTGRGSGRKRDPEPPGNRGGSGPGNADPVTDPATAPETVEEEAPEDLDSEAKVLWYLAKGNSASQAGIKAGLTDGRGRQIARIAREAPRGIDQEGSS